MTLTETIHRYLTGAPTSGFVGREVHVLDAWEGRDHLLWRVTAQGEEAVLKLFLDAGQARSRRQFDGQQRFAPLGLAPRPLWVDRYPEGLARQVLVYEWVPGDPLDPTCTADLAALAQSAAAVHRSDPDAVRRISPQPINLDYLWRILRGSVNQNLPWLEQLDARGLTEAYRRLAMAAEHMVTAALRLWAGVPPAAIHGDLALENALMTFAAAVLLDWERFGLGDPALEAAGFLYLHGHKLGAEGEAAWLQSYLTAVDDPAVEERIAVCRRLLPFQSLCILLDGLRELAGSPQPLVDEQDVLPFLCQTLEATFVRSAAALAEEVELDAGTVEALVNRAALPAQGDLP